ncbi:hypothetical protein GCM10010503_14480 [Streptomyces lucensis JCM 4490]|uniref:Uncharacterized protein n=1 Tax=Streptomyces lucensis JCM 4490 TaxID=1306176 RepID=A0A918J234_9ACTN|nr:hypothetical protein GCM10010503_14480 [Streptomyces lucensis JCM 4490]
MGAAWADTDVIAIPAVATATAAVVRAFFGEAMRRMKETDTENLLRWGQWIARTGRATRRGRMRRRRGPCGLVAPGDVVQRSRPETRPQ